MEFYTLGDAQIDAQNRTTSQIGDVLVQHDAQRDSGTLTADAVKGYINQIQGLIDNYAAQYGGTSRGAAGRITLQNFVDQNIFPAWQQEIQQLTPASQSISPNQTLPVPVIPNAQGSSGAGITTINIAPSSPGTPAALQPSGTPAPPSGITIPGTTQTVTAPPDYMQYALPIAVGLALWFAFVKK